MFPATILLRFWVLRLNYYHLTLMQSQTYSTKVPHPVLSNVVLSCLRTLLPLTETEEVVTTLYLGMRTEVEHGFNMIDESLTIELRLQSHLFIYCIYSLEIEF